MTGMPNLCHYADYSGIERSQITLAHLLPEARDATCASRKWQLGAKNSGALNRERESFDVRCCTIDGLPGRNRMFKPRVVANWHQRLSVS